MENEKEKELATDIDEILENAKSIQEKNSEYLSMLSKSKINRIIAWIGILITVGLIIVTFITGIMGSKYFMGCLFLCIMVPILFYVFLWFGKVLFTKSGR